MQVTDAQFQAADRGDIVELTSHGRGFVLLSRAAYDQVCRTDGDDALSPLATARLIRDVMAEDDAGDPTLDSYQQYKRHP